jgi:hypothetical protein
VNKFLACLFCFCKMSVDNDMVKTQKPTIETTISEPIFQEEEQVQVADDFSETISNNSRFPQVLSGSSSDGLFEDEIFVPLCVDYSTMKKDFMLIIEQSYKDDFISWKSTLIKESGIRLNHPYRQVTINDYVEFMRYANRDKNDVANQNLCLDIGQRTWFLGHQYSVSNLEKDLEIKELHAKIKTDFLKRLPHLPIALPSSAKKRIEDYFTQRIEEKNWKTFWDLFTKEAVILPASSKYISDLIDGSQTRTAKKPAFSVTKCNARIGLQKIIAAHSREQNLKD